MQPLALSRFSLVTSLGAGQAATIAALREGRSGLAPCTFAPAPLPTYVGAVPELDTFNLTGEMAGFDCRNNRLAAMALEQDGFRAAVAAARERYGAARVGIFLGTSTSGILETEQAYRRRDGASGALPAQFNYAKTHDTYSVGAFVREYLQLAGPTFVLSTACATTAKVFANAARMVAAGICDAAIVGGADTLCATTLYGFRSLNVMAEEPCRPFAADRQGISIGEAAGFALLENPAAAHDGDKVLLLGVGESSDAYHMSSPHPEGLGARLAMERALAAAGLRPDAIDYINLHGTATPVGDAAEDHAVADLFGPGTPCSSTKGATGHTLGASGIVEAIFSALGILHGLLPGSPHTRQRDPALKSGYLIEGRAAAVDRVMSNSFGFGGVNCSLVLGRA
ncbi:MAG TPA: beta-ketoacyl-[acyl-carrier-protein] synthase family protein [Candidatus Sulfotelmatobacter sp.]|nr:beta-ketoacyl-[acyl-carrier-protein] synthase family protein [Candidatus Sulfotelmatobacter sp.]